MPKATSPQELWELWRRILLAHVPNETDEPTLHTLGHAFFNERQAVFAELAVLGKRALKAIGEKGDGRLSLLQDTMGLSLDARNLIGATPALHDLTLKALGLPERDFTQAMQKLAALENGPPEQLA